MGVTVYEVITDRILGMLNAGVVPWRQPWAAQGAPKNLISKKEYRGMNVLLLACQSYTQPWWLTINQCKKLGGRVQAEEMKKSTPIIFWKIGKRANRTTGKEEKSFVLRYYKVWNVAQCEGMDDKVPAAPEADKVVEPIQACEDLVKLYKTIPPIDHGGSRAFYAPTFDRIGMPERSSFHGAEEYYSTLFHELVHSTGHKDRLDREGITNPIRFASHDYSFEELVAECGAAFLCGKAGIENRTLENSAAYIATWMKKLKSEPKWLVEAASKATKAADYIQGISAYKAEESEDEDEEVAA